MRPLWMTCLLFVAGSITLAATGPALSPSAALIGYALLFAPYLGLLWLLHRSPTPLRHTLWLILGAALIARVGFALSDPVFSDDIYRYVWDGRVGAAGINPYIWPPAADALASLRDVAVWPHINHAEIPTIYPPLAQMLFEVNAHLGGGIDALRMLLVGAEAGLVTLIAAIWWRTADDRQRGESKARFGLAALAIYLINPAVLVEGTWSGHIDVVAMLTLTAALLIAIRLRGIGGGAWSGALLGMSIAAKLISVIALPLILLMPRAPHRSRRADALRRVAMLGATALVVAASYAPYADAGEKMFAGFGAYATRWRGNDGPFRALVHTSAASIKAWSPPAMRADPDDPNSPMYVRLTQWDDVFIERGWTKEWQGRQIPNTTFAIDQVSETVAKFVVAGIMGLVLLWCLIVIRAPMRGALMLFGALFFFAPTLYPWYVIWLIPLAALRRSPTAILFSFVCLAAYTAWISSAAGGAWAVPWWVVALEFGAVALMWGWEVTRAPHISGRQ